MSRPDPYPAPAPEPAARPDGGRASLTCRDVIGLLLDYLEVTLDEDTVALFDRHLADCASCRAYLRTYDRSRQLAGEASRVEMPPEMRDRLRELLLGRLGPRSA